MRGWHREALPPGEDKSIEKVWKIILPKILPKRKRAEHVDRDEVFSVHPTTR
jgi:hypothetical protein